MTFASALCDWKVAHARYCRAQRAYGQALAVGKPTDELRERMAALQGPAKACLEELLAEAALQARRLDQQRAFERPYRV